MATGGSLKKMSKNMLCLRLDFRNPSEEAKCEDCGKKLKLFQRYHKVIADKDGYVYFFASPEAGFAKAETVSISLEKLKALDLPLAFEDFKYHHWQRLYQLLFTDKNGRVIWSRLRAVMTERYKHPKLQPHEHCAILQEKEEKGEKGAFITFGPPKTIFMWADPLIAALYALGKGYQEIADILELADPNDKGTGVKNSVRRRVEEYKDRYDEDNELILLHQLNILGEKYKCRKEYPKPGNEIAWDIVIEGKPLNDRTVNWLKTLAKQYKDSLEVTLAESEVVPIVLSSL
jgi:hypothetical protein